MKTVDFQGIKIRLDRPKGFVQTGTDDSGKSWKRVYSVDYGFIPKTQGGDGDGLDVFLGPHQDSPHTFWFTQKKSDGSFDEYKLVLGTRTKAEARKIYTDHIPAKHIHSCVAMSLQMLKALLGKEPMEKLATFLGFLSELDILGAK